MGWVAGVALATLSFIQLFILYLILRARKFQQNEREGKIFVQVIFREDNRMLKRVYGWVLKNSFNALNKDHTGFVSVSLFNETEITIRTSEVLMARKVSSFWEMIIRSRV